MAERSSKKRLDQLLLERGLASTPAQAEALILRGSVWVEKVRIDKPGTALDASCRIRIRLPKRRYVSRGGEKLEGAIRHFNLCFEDRVCLDLGASTGGFVDCLLQHGARRVYAFDVGRGQLDWKLRQDPRVEVREGVNVRYLEPGMVDERVDWITIDLSFISLRLVLPALAGFSGARLLALVKPQFEARRQEVGRGGVIRDPELERRVLDRVRGFCSRQGLEVEGEVPAIPKGRRGNQEHFLLMRWR